MSDDEESSSTTFFSFDQEPDVKVFYDEKYVITKIEGTKKDGIKVNNTDPKNPRKKESFSLTVSNLIVNKLRSYGFKGIPQDREKVERFKKVVDAFVTIATTKGKWGLPFHGDADWNKGDLSNYNNIVKFLYVADQVGFYSLKDKKRKQYATQVFKDPKQKKQQTEFDEFLKNPLVGRWRGDVYEPDNPNADDFGFVEKDAKFKDKGTDKAKVLRKALILLDMTPDQFIAGTVNPDEVIEAEKKIENLTNRLTEKTFQAVGIEKQQFPNKLSLKDWAYMDFIPTETEMEDPKTGNMVRVNFSKQRDSRFDPSSGGVMKELTKNLRHFAESNAVTGAWTTLWSQKTPVSKHGELDISIHYLKDFEECLKKKVDFAKGEGIIMEKEHVRKTNTQRAKRIFTKLYPDGSTKRYQKGDQISIVLANGEVIEPDQEYYNVKKIETNSKDWDYAYMYYRVAMDLGWRAEEAFTAGANRSASQSETGVYEETLPDGSKFLLLRIMTRKTAHVNRTHHGGAIITPETLKMISEKRDLVEQYMDTQKYTEKEALEHGIVQYYISNRVDELLLPAVPEKYGIKVLNEIHALVGADDYFTAVGTMDLPSNTKMRPDEKKVWRKNNWQIPQVVRKETNRDKIKAIMRKCYEEVLEGDLYSKYFQFHSLHALRHLFAQYWLKATEKKNGVRDFAMVMKMGHWGGIDVLMQFYGQTSNVEVTLKAMDVQTSYEDLMEEEKKQLEEKKKLAKLEEEMDNVDPDNLAEETGDELDPDTGEPTQPDSEQVMDDNQ